MDCQPNKNIKVYNWSNINHACPLCDGPGESAGLPCHHCEAELPWLTSRCEICALPLPGHGLVCGQCLRRPPAFSRVEVPWRYAFPIDSLITRFKHQAQWPHGRLLGELLARHLQHAFADGLPRPQALLAVPLGRKRLRQRGFNQAQMLADWLASALQLQAPDNWLARPREGAHQQDLNARARRRNLHQAFSLCPPAAVAGLHLALVDDVLTTGATAEALARLLRQAGALRVDLYCLARTPQPGD